MTRITNTGSATVVFRDDAGKHWLEPGQTAEVAGEQHLPYLLTLDGIRLAGPDVPRGSDVPPSGTAELRAWLTDRGIPFPPKARQQELELLVLEALHPGGKVPADDPFATSGGEAGDHPTDPKG
jgi:hypothetical protein